MRHTILALSATLALGSVASAAIRITEFIYSGAQGEFVELTNVGSLPVDLTGWKFADDRRALDPVTSPNGSGTRITTTNPFSLSGLGVVAPGESVLFTESTPDAFRAGWSLPASIKVLGDLGKTVVLSGSGTVADPEIREANGFNIGSADEINVYDAAGNLVDRLTYTDSPRAQRVSANTTPAAYGDNDYTQWFLAVEGDSLGSYRSAVLNNQFDVGNPGSAVIPEPASLSLLALGALALRRRA